MDILLDEKVDLIQRFETQTWDDLSEEELLYLIRLIRDDIEYEV